MNRKKLLYSVAMFAMVAALAGCDQEETTCTTDAECGGYICDVDTNATEGTCLATCEAGCATGYVCGGDSETECVESTVTCDDLECGNYACADSACFEDCTAENAETNCAFNICEVAEGADAGICAAEVVADPFLYVAVVSASTDVEGGNPGPDIDAISVSHGGVPTVAAVVEASDIGANDGSELTRTRPEAVTAKDVQNDDGSCNLDDWTAGSPDYFSLGGTGGFVVVSFGDAFEIVHDDIIEVIELDQAYCSNISVARDDGYQIYVGRGSIDVGTVTASSIQDGDAWCLIDASGGNGGESTTVFNEAACP